MAVLARKISRAKWSPAEGLDEGEIPADAVSADLRATNITLSFWSCATGGEPYVSNAVLALAAAADRVDRMDVAWIDESAVEGRGLATAPTKGRTPVASLQNTHVDVTKLDLRRLSTVAELVAGAIGSGQHRRMTKKQVVDILAEAVRDELVSLDDLRPGVREAVDKVLKRYD